MKFLRSERFTRRPYLPRPHHADTRTSYEAMAADSRLAFCGAPSSESNSGVSSLLRRVRRTVITNGRRRIHAFLPENGVCMIKREEASLPNGTRFKLTSTCAIEPRENNKHHILVGLVDHQFSLTTELSSSIDFSGLVAHNFPFQPQHHQFLAGMF